MQETQVWSLGWEDPLEEGPLQYSCLENPMSRGTWWATVHGVAKSQTDLATENACFLELHINGIIQFVLFCVWNAHGLICSTISLAKGWYQLPPHILNSMEKVREDCVRGPKAKILELEGLLWCHMLGTLSSLGAFSLGSWTVQCADRGKPVCSVQAASQPWSPTSSKCQDDRCLGGPMGHPLTQKQVVGSWLTIFLAILMPLQDTPYKSAEHLWEKILISSLTLSQKGWHG